MAGLEYKAITNAELDSILREPFVEANLDDVLREPFVETDAKKNYTQGDIE